MGVVNEAPAAFRSSADRPGPVALIRNAVTDVWSRRRLIGYLVRADVKKRGANTVLGNVWWVLDPLITMLIYVLVMTVIFQRATRLPALPAPAPWCPSRVHVTIAATTRSRAGRPHQAMIMFPRSSCRSNSASQS
jgi:hypothetical protein